MINLGCYSGGGDGESCLINCIGLIYLIHVYPTFSPNGEPKILVFYFWELFNFLLAATRHKMAACTKLQCFRTGVLYIFPHFPIDYNNLPHREKKTLCAFLEEKM